jgi:hypothetical protein
MSKYRALNWRLTQYYSYPPSAAADVTILGALVAIQSTYYVHIQTTAFLYRHPVKFSFRRYIKIRNNFLVAFCQILNFLKNKFSNQKQFS